MVVGLTEESLFDDCQSSTEFTKVTTLDKLVRAVNWPAEWLVVLIDSLTPLEVLQPKSGPIGSYEEYPVILRPEYAPIVTIDVGSLQASVYTGHDYTVRKNLIAV